MDREQKNRLLQQEKDRHEKVKIKQDKERNQENELHQHNNEYIRSIKTTEKPAVKIEANINAGIDISYAETKQLLEDLKKLIKRAEF